MTRFTFLDAITRLPDDILEYAATRRAILLNTSELRQPSGTGRKAPGKKSGALRWILLAASITLLVGALIPVGIFFMGRTPGTTTDTTDRTDPPIPAADVHLTAISGQTLTEAPENPASAASISAGRNANLTLLSAGNSNGNGNVNGNGNGGNGNHYGWKDVATHEIPAIPQSLVLFDDNRYAGVGIELDNPYDYYIADFYMICDQPGAQIFVDDRWIPLDGSIKIRWTGATNRYTSYYVYIPEVSEGASITITDMRYLNETEIAVDMQEHNVANIYQIESPVRTEFIVNTQEAYYFRIIQSSSVTSLNVENASPSSFDPKYSDLYELTKDGTYTIHYTFTVPGTKVTGSGTITSPEIELLKIIPVPHPTNDLYTTVWMDPYEATHNRGYLGLTLYGSGMTFHSLNANDSFEKNFINNLNALSIYFCDQEFEVRIDGEDALIPGNYSSTFPFDIYTGAIYCITSKSYNKSYYVETADGGIDYVDVPIPVEVYWNGYLIFLGMAYC